MNHLKSLIREVPDFPKPGILFYDITTLLKDPKGLHELIDGLGAGYSGKGITKVIGIEARGFIFAPAVAYALNAGFVPVRKPKKLPAATERVQADRSPRREPVSGNGASRISRSTATSVSSVLTSPQRR